MLPVSISLSGVALVTVALLAAEQDVAVAFVPIGYLIPVIFAATRWGIWPATLAAIASVAAADFFFFPPLHSFELDNPQDAIDLLLFLVVALVSSNLASRLRDETHTLRRREREIQQLYEFSRRLATCFTMSDLISAIQKYLSRALGSHATFFMATGDGHIEQPQSDSPPKFVLENSASMIATIGAPDRTVVDPATGQIWLLRSVHSDTETDGVIAVNIGTGTADIIATRKRRVDAILQEVSLTLQRLDIGKAMADARLRLQAQLLRDAFHGTLSHELCSPLAAIGGSASVLGSIPAIARDAQARPLVEAIQEEAAELNGYIQNLLNATRVAAGGLTPRPEWTDPRDIVNAAIKRTARRLRAHRLNVDLAEELPLVWVDSGLIEEACGQLLENAAKYSPSGSDISVRATTDPQQVILTVSDQGVGITPDEQRQLGRRSYRSRRHHATIPGSGLGFWIASTFARANGGTITLSSRGPGLGTTASIVLPAGQSDLFEPAICGDEHE